MQQPTTAARALHVPRGRTKSRPATGTADQADERTGSSDARTCGVGDGTLDGSDGWKQLGWSWGMTASIPGENDTKRHRIALAALPSSCQPATLCRRQNPVECRRTERPWYIEAVGDRASSSCMRAEQHTREKCTAPPTRPIRPNLRGCVGSFGRFRADSRIFRFLPFLPAESKPAHREESID